MVSVNSSGRLFIALSRNPADGMSYVREIPALLVDDIELDADDMERELRYHQLTNDMAGRWWLAAAHPRAAEADQVVLHFAVNRPAGAARGLPDLLPILRWLRRYQDWVEDRARLNKYRSAFLWHCQVTNPAPGELERKRAQYAKAPTPGSILVTDQNEQWQAVHAQLDADDLPHPSMAGVMLLGSLSRRLAIPAACWQSAVTAHVPARFLAQNLEVFRGGANR